MKRVSTIVSVLIILSVIYWSFADLKPSTTATSKSTRQTAFSLNNALNHLKNISKEAHYVGSKEHKKSIGVTGLWARLHAWFKGEF